MASARLIHIVIALAAVIWGAMLIFEHAPLGWEFLRPYEVVAAVVVLLVNVYDWWLWRVWPFVLISPTPLLRGTWRGELRTSWVDPKTGQSPPPIKVYLALQQTASRLEGRMFTPNSTSNSTATTISVDGGARQLVSTYQNVPDLLQRSSSPIHNGTMLLEVPARFSERMKGWYWTDRQSQGEVVFDAHSSKVAGDLVQAKALKYAPRARRAREAVRAAK